MLPVLLKPFFDFGGKSIGFFLGLFLLGYYVISEDSVMERIVKHRVIYLVLMLISDVANTYLYIWIIYPW